MSYSFTNPIVDGRIWNPSTGESIDLTLIGEDKIPYCQGVEIDIGLGGNLDITVHLTPTYDSAVKLIDETDWLKYGNTLGVRWGYNDGDASHISDWYYSFMQLPEVNFGEEITIDLKASGPAWGMSSVESTRVWSTNENPKSLYDIFGIIAQKYGLEVSWSLEALKQKDYFGEPRAHIQACLTDLQFIERNTRLANPRVDMIIRGNKLIFACNPLGHTTPAAEFHMYGKMNPKENIFPMTGFSPEQMGSLFLPSRTFSSQMFGPNTDPTATVEKVDSMGNESSGEAAGDENNISGDGTLCTPGKEAPPDPDSGLKVDVKQDAEKEAGKMVPLIIGEKGLKKNVKNVLDSVRQDTAGDYGIIVNFETIGIPTLVPEQIIRLKGVTKFFSTDYRIHDMGISIGDGGAEMSIKAMAHGLSLEMAYQAEAVKTFAQGDTEPGDGGENVEPDPNAGA